MAADHAGEVRVALADLRYEGTGTSVIFPESTAVFDTGRRALEQVQRSLAAALAERISESGLLLDEGFSQPS